MGGMEPQEEGEEEVKKGVEAADAAKVTVGEDEKTAERPKGQEGGKGPGGGGRGKKKKGKK